MYLLASRIRLLLENVDNLLRLSDIRVVLKVNLDKDNILSYEKLCKEIKKRYGDYIDKKRVIISHNFVRNRNNFKGCENCLSEEEYFDRFYDNNKAINYISNIAAPCPLRSRSDFAIGPDGNIYKCLEFLGNKKRLWAIYFHTILISRIKLAMPWISFHLMTTNAAIVKFCHFVEEGVLSTASLLSSSISKFIVLY